MTHDYLDKWLRETRQGQWVGHAIEGRPRWSSQDTDPNWHWDSETAAECGRAAGGTGEPNTLRVGPHEDTEATGLDTVPWKVARQDLIENPAILTER